MMRCRRHHITPLFIAILGSSAALWGCKEPYISPYQSPVTGYLVVEGYISGNGATQFTLSRTIPLPGKSPLPKITGAAVEVEGTDGSVYPLTEMGNGIYSDSNALPLTTAAHYKLRIKTPNGEEYLSDTVPFKPTPPIDSVNFIQNNDNSVNIYVNSHDPTNNTRYYLWNWDQTFEYHSAEESLYYWDPTLDSVLLRPDTAQVYRCWLSGSSSSILVGNSMKLAQDEIYRQKINMIPPNDVQLSVLYTTLVRQYALTQAGYNFLSLMQQNTESLGSIFDAQPSALKSNIHCLTNPSEEVIGYVSAGTVQQYRLWISREQIQSSFDYQCDGKDGFIPLGDTTDYKNDFGSVYSPISFTVYHGLQGYGINYTDCLVCTWHGGTNHAPSYWPN